MEMEIAFLSSLVILLIGTQIFWMRHTHILVNKIMSRDYEDYALQESRLKKQKIKTEKIRNYDGPNELGIMNEYI